MGQLQNINDQMIDETKRTIKQLSLVIWVAWAMSIFSIGVLAFKIFTS